ncbi:MAG: hypothetical protein ACPL4K_03985, partial [Candidatus Margulisiibacteriota bacterium]
MPRKRKSSLLGKISFLFLIVFLAASAGILLNVFQNLPDIGQLSSYLPSESTLVYSADGKILARFHREENRQVVPLSKISPYF